LWWDFKKPTQEQIFCGHGLPTADKNGIYKKEFGENSSS